MGESVSTSCPGQSLPRTGHRRYREQHPSTHKKYMSIFHTVEPLEGWRLNPHTWEEDRMYILCLMAPKTYPASVWKVDSSVCLSTDSPVCKSTASSDLNHQKQHTQVLLLRPTDYALWLSIITTPSSATDNAVPDHKIPAYRPSYIGCILSSDKC